MSTIRVDDVGPSAGGTTKSLVRGTASAWVNFNGEGTIAARDSLNLSSLTDNGTGKYTTSFTNSFDSANYSCVSQCSYKDAGSSNATLNMFETTGLSVSSAPYICQFGGGGNVDRPYNFISNDGDLA